MIRPAQDVYGMITRQRYAYHNLYEIYLRVITGILTDLGIQAYTDSRHEEKKEILLQCIQGIYDGNRSFPIGTSTVDLMKELDRKYGSQLPDQFRRDGWTISAASLQGAPDSIREKWYDHGSRTLATPGNLGYGSGTLMGNNKILPWGRYAIQCMQMYYCLNSIDRYRDIMNILGRSVYVVNLIVRMRNILYAHTNQNANYFNLLEKLTNWLSGTDDPVFGRQYTICGAGTADSGTRKIKCIKENSYDFLKLEKRFLLRANLIGDDSVEDDIFNSVYLFIDDWNLQDLGLSDYIRISPYLGLDTAKVNRRGLIYSDYYGLLLHVTRQKEYRYMYMMDAEDSLIKNEEGSYTFDLEADAGLRSADENDPTIITHNNVKINKSRHPEFVEAQIEDKEFIYLKIIDDTDDQLLEKFQTKNSYVFFIYIYGHGGLGKTHIVINMLRDKYLLKGREKKGRKKEEPYFKQIIFLSAKKKIMDVERRREVTLDKVNFDVETYEDVLRALYAELIDEEDRNMDEAATSISTLEDEIRRHVEKRKDPVLIVIDDLDTMSVLNEKKVCQFLGGIQCSECRIIITSRYLNSEHVRLVPVTLVSLSPLNEEGSWNFIQKYIAKKQGSEREAKALMASWYMEGQRRKKKRLYQITGGVPLKLVILAGMLLHGYDANSVWSAAEGSMKITDTFIYRNLLENVSSNAKEIMGTLGAIITTFSDGESDEFREIGLSTLRLFLPELTDRDFSNGIDELVDVSVFIRISGGDSKDNAQVLFRSPELSGMKEIRELSLPESTRELLDFMKADRKKWRAYFYFTGTLLDVFHSICNSWRRSGDESRLEWVSHMTAIVLTRDPAEFGMVKYENWVVLEKCINIEISINTLEEYGYEEYSDQWDVIIRNLEGLENYFTVEKDLILRAYQTLLDYAVQCQRNGNGDLAKKIRKNTVESYNQFCIGAGRDFLDVSLDEAIQKAAFVAI